MIKNEIFNLSIKEEFSISKFQNALYELLDKLNIKFMRSIDFNFLIIDERAPFMCQFGCKNYNSHYSCPPHSFSPKRFRAFLKKWDFIVIYSISETLEEFWNIRHQRNLTNFTFMHKKILSRLTENRMRKLTYMIEDFFKSWGFEVFGLAGGSCHSCKICGLKEGKPCKKPEKMRMSLESVGIDVEKTFSYNGYDISMPNIGSSVRAAGLLIRGKLPKIKYQIEKSPQNYSSGKEVNLNLIRDNRKIDFIELISTKDIKQQFDTICKSDCKHYGKNYSCPPYVKQFNIRLWKNAIVWRWNRNNYKNHSYSKTIEYIHKTIFNLGYYFALPLRHCYCNFCDYCTYGEFINIKNDLREPCRRYRLLAPAMESIKIDMEQFGEGIYGIELI